MMFARLTRLLAVAACAIWSAPAESQQRRQGGPISVSVVNRAATSLHNLHITPSDNPAWGEDRLGKETLAAGARQTVRVDRAPGCRYDIRAVFSDGDHDIMTDINLCASAAVTLTGDNDVTPLRLVRLAARRPVSLFLVYNRTGVEMREMHVGAISTLEGMTVDPGDHTVGRFRRSDGCAANLAAEFKDSDPVFLGGHDLCAQPVVSFAAPERKTAVRIRNKSAYPLVSLHVRPAGFEAWGGDRLGSDTLQPRDVKRIRLTGTSSCLFDVKAEFSGSEAELRTGVNLCERALFDLEGPELVTGKGDKKTAAPAGDEKETLKLTVVNEAARTIREVFVSPARTKNWGENLLEASLSLGASAALRIDHDGSCLFDMRVVREGGFEQRRMNQDLCKTDKLSIGGPYRILIDGGGPEVGFPVSFVNVGRADLRSLHLTPSNDTHWGEDRLGSSQLERRSRLDLRLPRAGGCFWDLKASFEDGVPEEQRRVDLCAKPHQQIRQREKPGAVISTGTGFFVNADGYVVTNSHVAEGCRVVAIAREGEARVPLRLIRDDPEIDLALLKADAAPTPYIGLRSSVEAPVRPGEKAIVIGYPMRSKLGVVNVTEGVVSAAGGASRDHTRMQFTAPAQPGNSGGPILDVMGLTIGVVVAQLGAREDERPSQNINFGVSVAAVEAFLKQAGVIAPKPVQAANDKPTPEIFEGANAAVLPLDCLE